MITIVFDEIAYGEVDQVTWHIDEKRISGLRAIEHIRDELFKVNGQEYPGWQFQFFVDGRLIIAKYIDKEACEGWFSYVLEQFKQHSPNV